MKGISRTTYSLALVFMLALAGLAQKPATKVMPPPPGALGAITAERVMEHVKVLASDEYEGRAPATRGERLTISYIADQFKKAGLAPGNTDGTYFQKVPLVGITANPDARLEIKAGDKNMDLKYGDDFVAWTKRVTDTTSIDADMVFVGYGVVAPEYNWDDYKDVDVRGKVIVMLINDPAIADPQDSSKLDPKMFGGRAMTYYGRWTYKFEIAAAKGAAGALIIHETEPASYGWEVVKGSWTVEQFDLVAKDKNMSRVAVEGWLSNEQSRALLQATGKSLEELKRAALSRDFKPVPLGAHARLTLKNNIRTSDSHNVVGKLEGGDPRLKNEYVVYMGHWDHLGVGIPNASGDKIYNGALDNASGVAGLIEIARAYKALPRPPRRSIIFLAVTAEEKGLIGSQHYAENPIYPLAKTVAAINMDVLNFYGRTSDITVVGLGNSTLDDVLSEAANEQGRKLSPDPTPERGSYYRSDHFNFAKKGVPALYADGGSQFIGKPADYGEKKSAEYNRNDYHKPSDDVKSDWDLSGAVEDLKLLFTVGYRIANTDKFPEWKPGTEFKAVREKMLSASSRTGN